MVATHSAGAGIVLLIQIIPCGNQSCWLESVYASRFLVARPIHCRDQGTGWNCADILWGDVAAIYPLACLDLRPAKIFGLAVPVSFGADLQGYILGDQG